MKRSMTNFDINAVLSELSSRITGSELKNIFEVNNIFFFRFRNPEFGRQTVVVEPGRRLHPTKFKRDFPPSPSGLCKAFRIHIKNKWLKRVYQYDFDRVVVFEFEAHDEIYTLIVELFGRGNVILVSPKKKILVAEHYKKMRDRDIHPGISFEFPPSRGRNFMEADLDWVKKELLEASGRGLLQTLSWTLNIGKDYARELCLRAEIEPSLKVDDLTEAIINTLLEEGVKDFRKKIADEAFEPHVYFDPDSGELEDITPFPLHIYSSLKSEKRESISEALDTHFTSIETDRASDEELSAEEQKINQLKEVKRKQEEHLESLRETAAEAKEEANLLYLHLQELDELLATITKARRNKVEWSEIKEKLMEAKKKGMRGARFLEKINEHQRTLLIEIDDQRISLDFLQSVADNATRLYDRAKKAESKIPGAKNQIAKLEGRIHRLEEGLEELAEKETIMIEKRDRNWFEKFHWFRSSDGFLVLAGKNLRSNEMLVKRYMEKDDLFLHAEIHGAAAVVIKSEGKKIPQNTIDEAAVFSVCYSRAWKDMVSTADTYWVSSDQVSFSPPSGEYLAKGSFIIEGEKHEIRNVPLEIAVAPVIEEKWAYVIAGPRSAIESSDNVLTSRIIHIIPGDIPKSRVAKKIVAEFTQGLNEADKVKIEDNALNELISILPGDSYIKYESS
ncbi:MAG: DUF814 domain-containing protein [Candidatus Heimdallarchaeota archaeon]|nr:DUF814 domain-containing protein [Candidatus Heimdallarchaeota archaeon]